MINNKYFSTFLLIPFLIFSFELIAKESNVVLLTAEEGWFKEDLKFPLSFARKIELTGDVNLRFPSGWSKSDHDNFWSYVWAWQIDDNDGLNENELKKSVEIYFDGLLGLNDKRFKNSVRAKQKTTAKFKRSNDSKTTIQYLGEVNTIDTRYTKQPMTLFVQVEQFVCEKKNQSVLLFRYSPKPFGHTVWNTLSKIELIKGLCGEK